MASQRHPSKARARAKKRRIRAEIPSGNVCDESGSNTQRPPLPPGIRIVKDERPLPSESGYRDPAGESAEPELVLERRWFDKQHLIMLPFCIALDAFLVAWFGGAPASFVFLVFPLIPLALALGLTYYTLAGLLNKTTLRITDGLLFVRHAPVPWRGNLVLPTIRIRQLRVCRIAQGENSQSVTYAVDVVVDRRSKINLVAGLHSREQARFIEWIIEDHLGIRDASTN